MKRLSVLGSTGSIGTQTLEVVRAYPEDFKVVVLAAGSNVDKMEEQVREFHPKLVCMWSEKAAADLKNRIADTGISVVPGMDGLLQAATFEQADVVLTAVVGMIGIQPTIAAIEAGKEIALANKETLVTAGHIIMPLAAAKKVPILPVDSEHSAIFQSLQGSKREEIKKILLTASGGPFRGKTRKDLEHMTVQDALNHPNWSMGRKITIDSASLVNKGLEVMEAKWLFGVERKDIEVVVHPQSILHSAVMYRDGAVIGQMGVPDMKLPIQYALFYPDRNPMEGNDMDLFQVGSMTFEKPDIQTFRGLQLAYDALDAGGSMPTVFNAANEMAVAMFLDQQIRFLQIPEIIEASMEQHKVIENPDLGKILETEQATYDFIKGKTW
ncbi:MAG: 1-deoxy-D-xylulose-5-phosphate reductoisomerase [Lachnospiraceae bacterium]|nr:1-deoxy-D-xylulose-5-phosphate reductoisomerase [Lachnospiraceae bacterium]